MNFVDLDDDTTADDMVEYADGLVELLDDIMRGYSEMLSDMYAGEAWTIKRHVVHLRDELDEHGVVDVDDFWDSESAIFNSIFELECIGCRSLSPVARWVNHVSGSFTD